MYQRLSVQSGVQAVQNFRSTFPIQSTPDGLVFTPPGANAYYGNVTMPERLRKYLIDLRLLRHIPVAYFVPDAALLPPESIRFFHIDPTWMDRVIDGVISAVDTGTVDTLFNGSLVAMTRNALDADLTQRAKDQGMNWTPAQGMTGMLIRSELVRRWPNMIIRAYSSNAADEPTANETAVLRAEPISKDLYIAIFAGTPALVHVREPNVGIRFGIEEAVNNPNQWSVAARKTDGSQTGGHLPVSAKNAAKRTIDISALVNQIKLGQGPASGTSRMVALQLERNPFVQEFRNTVKAKVIAEKTGSVPLENYVNSDGTLKTVPLRAGRVLNLQSLVERQAQLKQMSPKEKP